MINNDAKQINNFKVVHKRLPLMDCTNSNMPKTNLKSNKMKRNPKKRVREKCLDGETRIVLERNQEVETRILTFVKTIGRNNKTPDKLQDYNSSGKKIIGAIRKQSIPLVGRLRKCTNKNYLESSLENSVQHDESLTNVKSKVPIYKQNIPVNTVINPKDPYALDFEFDEEKPKKKKLDDSAKFNRTMYEVLSKIEKNEKRKATRKKIVQKNPKKYEENINEALRKVMLKVAKKKEIVSKPSEQTSKCRQKDSHEVLPMLTDAPKRTYTKKSTNDEKSFHNLGILTGEEFLGFDNSGTHSDKNHNSSQSSPYADTGVQYHSTPHIRLQSNLTSRINILSNISLTDESLINTSMVVPLVEKSHNLHREFQENPSLLNNQSMLSCKTFQRDEMDDNFENDNYIEEFGKSEDKFFGFEDEMDETSDFVNNQMVLKKKQPPWRFRGFFKRNPHILRIKKNGLPCLQQEMVVDHEFVKRIEALSEHNTIKHPEPPPAKLPVQTSMLDYIHPNRGGHADPQRISSLFDYEEFNVAKSPRKVLGVLHDNRHIVSTPKRIVETAVASPNVSFIPRDEDIENRMPVCYKKKRIVEESEKNVREEEMLPSILEKDFGEINEADIKLFEDVDGDEKIDSSIQVPHFKYANKRQRKKYFSEETDDEEEKKPKKKKKDERTKAEMAEFNAWAAKINAQFEEVDKHDLTIE